MSDNTLIQKLLNPAAYDHPVTQLKLLDTHVSWVILTGPYAYKIKKPVDFEFLNYSTLEKRKFYCEEEIRLNKPFAPELYLEVVTISGDEQNPKVNHAGKVLDYAIKMREFPQDNLLSEVLARKQLTPYLIDQLAKLIAEFHQKTTVAAAGSVFGTPEHVHAPVLQNFEQITAFLTEEQDKQQLQRLQQWSEQQFKQHYNLLAARKAQGFIRECHGDLHLKNIILFNDKPLLFDRIEFNEDFRWTDTMADVGFLAMDLDDNKQTLYARRFLNQYFSDSGDYAGLALLPYYQAYRAIVRAKVALFSLYSAQDEAEKQECWQKYHNFMILAESYTQTHKSVLYITYGLSGSGKSTVAGELVAALGAIQIRSDVERKRLMDLTPAAKTNSALLQGIYTPELTKNTYDHLAGLTQIIIKAGYSVIVDATFLEQTQRAQFQQLANKLQTRFIILHCYAERAQIVQWLQERAEKQHEPSEAGLEVLELLEKTQQPLTAAEQVFVVAVNTAEINIEALEKSIHVKKHWPEAIEGRIATKNKTGFMFTEISGASPAFIEHAKKSSGIVMDLGCAYGVVTLQVLQQANCKVIAFDLAQEHLDILRASVSAAEAKKLITMQGYFPDNFKVEENSLDAIHSSCMLHFFTGTDLENGLHKCLLALKPGGKIYINVVSPFFSAFKGVLSLYEKNAVNGAKYPGEIFNYKQYADEKSVSEVPDFLHVYKIEGLQQALQSAGFIVDEVFYYDKKEPAWFVSDGKGHVAAIASKSL